MKTLYAMLVLMLLVVPTFAQESFEAVVQVLADSAFVRVLPDQDAEPSASVYSGESLIAVGRNIDGQWLEVRRPGRTASTGWVSRQVIGVMFELGALPVTDFETGLIGPELVIDTGYAAQILQDTSLHVAPDRLSQRLVEPIPVNLILPVIERTPDRIWVKVNYLGTPGWIAEFRTRVSPNVDGVPVSPQYADDQRFSQLDEIPLETQLAQIERLLDYLYPLNTTSADVADYWRQMSLGETLECLPLVGNYAYYAVAAQDLRELPELRRQERNLMTAIDDLNASIEAMKRCGVYTASDVRSAYADVLNARGIFWVVFTQAENLRERLIENQVS